MRYSVLFGMASLLVACASAPVSRQAFIAENSAGGMRAVVVNTSVKRGYEQVVTDLHTKISECLSFTRIRQDDRNMGLGIAGTYIWATIKSTNMDKTEITFRTNSKSRAPHNALDGAVSAATDVQRTSKNTTQVVTYASSLLGKSNIADTVRDWSEGKMAPCPKEL